MLNTSISKVLEMLGVLVNHGPIGIAALSEKLGVTSRMIYRYMEALKEVGVEVRKEKTKYYVSPTSPYLLRLVKGVRFSQNEALTIAQVLNSVNSRSPEVRHLREKLAVIYNKKVLSEHGVDERVAENLEVLYNAIMLEQVVCLRNYESPSSGQVSDRYVEPFVFLSGNTEVRCYELLTGMNKTFKIARAQSVELLELKWSFKERHRLLHVDIFQFSGEQTMPVSLCLGTLAKNVLMEECPMAKDHLTPTPDGRFILNIEVCSYKGVGRFVLGLYEDIEVVGSESFRAYIRDCVANMSKRFK
jgi:predicted DNA-binding transcriptional regulator YafY